jgi:hypothetical protein
VRAFKICELLGVIKNINYVHKNEMDGIWSMHGLN